MTLRRVIYPIEDDAESLFRFNSAEPLENQKCQLQLYDLTNVRRIFLDIGCVSGSRREQSLEQTAALATTTVNNSQ